MKVPFGDVEVNMGEILALIEEKSRASRTSRVHNVNISVDFVELIGRLERV